MSNDWVMDIADMHAKFGVNDWQYENKDDRELMQKYMKFRMDMIQEEVDETNAAIITGNPEEVVDGLIDMCVFAIGTLEVFGVDANKAWDQVLKANMSKEVGIKEGRPNPLNLPDLVKPEGWEGPTHKGNHGNITDSF